MKAIVRNIADMGGQVFLTLQLRKDDDEADIEVGDEVKVNLHKVSWYVNDDKYVDADVEVAAEFAEEPEETAAEQHAQEMSDVLDTYVEKLNEYGVKQRNLAASLAGLSERIGTLERSIVAYDAGEVQRLAEIVLNHKRLAERVNKLESKNGTTNESPTTARFRYPQAPKNPTNAIWPVG